MRNNHANKIALSAVSPYKKGPSTIEIIANGYHFGKVVFAGELKVIDLPRFSEKWHEITIHALDEGLRNYLKKRSLKYPHEQPNVATIVNVYAVE